MAKDFNIEMGKDRRNAGFASVDLRTDKNRISGKFPLYARLGISECFVEGAEASYRVFFLTGALHLDSKNLEEDWSGGSYSVELKKSSVSTRHSVDSKEVEGHGWKIEGQHKGAISGSAHASHTHQQTETENTTTSFSSEVLLIEPRDNLKWAVGHPQFGDPRKTGKFLSGQYFTETGKPLSHMAVCQGHEYAQITATFSVRRSDAHVINPSYSRRGYF